MKKIIGIIGALVIALTMFFNVSLSSRNMANDNLVTLTSIANANATDGERYQMGICIYGTSYIPICNQVDPSGPCDKIVNCFD